MRVPARRSTDTTSSMTPLIDVVFLLIIFFLVSSHLARRENLFPVELPPAKSTSVADTQTDRLTLTIDAEGRLLALGRPINVDELPGFIATLDAPPPVRVRADRSVRYQIVAPILRGVALAGCTDIVIAADPAASP